MSWFRQNQLNELYYAARTDGYSISFLFFDGAGGGGGHDDEEDDDDFFNYESDYESDNDSDGEGDDDHGNQQAILNQRASVERLNSPSDLIKIKTNYDGRLYSQLVPFDLGLRNFLQCSHH